MRELPPVLGARRRPLRDVQRERHHADPDARRRRRRQRSRRGRGRARGRRALPRSTRRRGRRVPQSGMLIAPGTADLLDAAVGAGAALVGGIDPAGLDGDAVAHLDTVFAIADRRGCGVDVHLHDRGTLGRWQLGLIVERTRALGLQGRVTVSHAFCLCDGDPAVEPLLEQPGRAADRARNRRARERRTAPARPDRRTRDRGLPRTGRRSRSLVAVGRRRHALARRPAGVACGLPAGRRHRLLRRDREQRGAAALGVVDQVVAPGGRGDLVLVDASCPAEAAVAHPPRLLVVKRGVPVSGPLAVG